MTEITNLIEKCPKTKDDNEAILALMGDLNLNFFIPNGFYVYSFLKDSMCLKDSLQSDKKLAIRSFKIVDSRVSKIYDKEIQIFYVRTIPAGSYGSQTLGLTPEGGENHILILEDAIEGDADKIISVTNDNRIFNFLNDHLESYLYRAPEFSWPYFERLIEVLPQIRGTVTEIIKKDFFGSISKEEITKSLRRRVEIHELTHKTNEITGLSSSSIGLVDAEVAAYLSELALLNITYYNLVEIFGTYLEWTAARPANWSAAKIIFESLATKAYQREGREWDPQELLTLQIETERVKGTFLDPLKALEVLRFLSSLERKDLQALAKELYEEKFNRPLSYPWLAEIY